TAQETLSFVGQVHGMATETFHTRSTDLLSLMDLTSAATTLVADFSHGMRKKLSLAAALLPAPRLLFLDEPFEGIDAVAVSGIRRMLQDLVARGAMTVFLTSHVLEVVERLVTHVGIIHRGRLVVQGTLDEVRASGTLEETFIRAVGEARAAPQGLSWLAAARGPAEEV
ncbi:MAG: AAA family ATPase, partial [Anaeromyxobacteraceae bacterium]